MQKLRSIGGTLAVLGLIGLVGPWFGFGLRGTDVSTSRLAGGLLLAVGLVPLGVGAFGSKGPESPR